MCNIFWGAFNVTLFELGCFFTIFSCAKCLGPEIKIYFRVFKNEVVLGDFPRICHGYPGTLVRGGSTVGVAYADSVRVTKSLSSPRPKSTRHLPSPTVVRWF
jgi:hypothetical protein